MTAGSYEREEGRMSYLAAFVAGRPSRDGTRPGVRVDERTPLNRPKLDGGAYVRVFVEDTSGWKRRRFRPVPPSPRLRLRIADCMNEIALEFAVESAELRENSLYKIETLLAALRRFRDALAVEAALYAERELLVSGSSVHSKS
jgi:hypothetical protein